MVIFRLLKNWANKNLSQATHHRPNMADFAAFGQVIPATAPARFCTHRMGIKVCTSLVQRSEALDLQGFFCTAQKTGKMRIFAPKPANPAYNHCPRNTPRGVF